MALTTRILHVFSTFGPGGPQVRTCELMNALGPEFSHIVMAMDGHVEAQSRIGEHINFRILPAPEGKGSVLYPLALRRVLEQIRPDLLATYNWGAFDAVMASAVSPVCPVIHAEDGFNSDEAGGLRRRRVWLRRALLNRVYGVVVPSRTLLAIAIDRYRLRPERVLRIANGIDVRRFRPGRDAALRRAWGVSDSAVLFGYTGRLTKEKNLALLLRAFAAAGEPGAKLAIAGQGYCRAELEEMARALGIAGRVVFTGLVEDVAPCYRAFDVFVMSSLTEQMPMSLLEAMASGLPAVSTDVGDCAEVIGARQSGSIVPSGDVAAYAAAIRAYTGSATVRATAGAQNRSRAVERFSFDRMVASYRDLYRGAAAVTPLPPDTA